MPFKNHPVPMFTAWRPDEAFNPEVDRLLVQTSWYDYFIARWFGDNADEGNLIMDNDFLPENLSKGIPSWLWWQHGLNVENSQSPWYIFLYDGTLVGGEGGHQIEMEAIGEGWSLKISTSLTPGTIEPFKYENIDRSDLARNIDGIHFGKFQTTLSLPEEIQAASRIPRLHPSRR